MCMFHHTQIVCKGPALFMFYVSTCRVSTATTQANLPPDGDLPSGFIGSFILQRARSLSLYVNSSAFCPTPLWILLCMWTHRLAEWGTAQKRKTILGVDVVWKISCLIFSWQRWSRSPGQAQLNRFLFSFFFVIISMFSYNLRHS